MSKPRAFVEVVLTRQDEPDWKTYTPDETTFEDLYSLPLAGVVRYCVRGPVGWTSSYAGDIEQAGDLGNTTTHVSVGGTDVTLHTYRDALVWLARHFGVTEIDRVVRHTDPHDPSRTETGITEWLVIDGRLHCCGSRIVYSERHTTHG